MVLDVGPVAHGGHCVARHEGRVVFVRHTLPGERVRVRVTEGDEGSPFLRGDAIAVLRPSPHRVAPPCPYAHPEGCGGCDWQHVDPAQQRELKADVVAEQLSRLSGIELRPVVEPVSGDEDGLRWRTRVELAVDPCGTAGLRKHRSHEVVPIEDCLIATKRVVDSGVLARDWSGQQAVDVTAASAEPEVAVVPIPAETRTPTSTVPAVHERVRVGDWSATFRLGARGFWQVHPGAAATFLAQAVEVLDPQPGEAALDLYAGVGLFARALADRVGPSGSVLAVEGSRWAAADAEHNLRDQPWAQVRHGRVDRVLRTLTREGVTADVVVLDPPRTGAGRSVVEQVCALRPRAVAYVACDPAALARDLAHAAAAGYRRRSLRAFDAFPMTHHVECIAGLVPA